MADGPDGGITQTNNGSGGMTASEVTSLVNLFNGMLLAMEGRLTAKMDDNARAATERWAKHDYDAQVTLASWSDRFLKLEEALDRHLRQEEDEDLIVAARIKPVKTTIQYLASNWRTILLLIVSLLAILGFSTRTFQEIIGG